MDSSQQISQVLIKKDFKQALLIALSNSLKIKTKTVLKTDNKNYQITKEIDLVNGSKNHLDLELLKSENNQIISFHQQQVKELYPLWEKNRETLVTIMQLLAGNTIDFTPPEETIDVDNSEESQGFTQQYIADIPENFDDLGLEDDGFSASEDQDFDFQENDGNKEENWVDDVEYSADEEELEFKEEVIISHQEEDFDGDEVFEDDDEDYQYEIGEKAEEGDWDELLEDMPENSDGLVVENSDSSAVSSPSAEVEEDWEEWLDEGNNGEEAGHNPVEIEWNQEDWEESEN